MLGMLETDAARPQSMEALLEGAMQAVTGDPAWLSYTDDRGGGDSTGKRCSRLMRTLESLHLTCSSDLDSSTARQAAVVRATVQVIKQLTENGGVVRKEVAEVVAAVANAMKSQDVYAAIKNLVTACARKCQLASSLKIITSLETRHAVNVALATAAFRNELLMIVCGSAIAHTQHITVNEYANFEICAFLAALHGGPEYLRVHVPPLVASIVECDTATEKIQALCGMKYVRDAAPTSPDLQPLIRARVRYLRGLVPPE
jgi:hypothetical protein